MSFESSEPVAGIINIFYTIELSRGQWKPHRLGTVPILDSLGEWFAKSVLIVPDLKRPTWNDEIRVYKEPEHKLILTCRLGWVEVEPLGLEQKKPLIEVVQ